MLNMESLSHLNFEVDYSSLRNNIRDARVMSELDVMKHLQLFEQTGSDQRTYFETKTTELIKQLRSSSQPDLLSLFVSEYNLTSCLLYTSPSPRD